MLGFHAFTIVAIFSLDVVKFSRRLYSFAMFCLRLLQNYGSRVYINNSKLCIKFRHSIPKKRICFEYTRKSNFTINLTLSTLFFFLVDSRQPLFVKFSFTIFIPERTSPPTIFHIPIKLSAQTEPPKRSARSLARARWVRPAPNASIYHQAQATRQAKKPCIHSERRPCSPSEPGSRSRSREAPGNGFPIQDSRAVTFGQRKQG